MTQSTFDYILENIESHISKHSNFRECISPKHKLILTLRYLGTGATFDHWDFHSECHIQLFDKWFMKPVIWNNLNQKHMPFPTESTFSSIAEQFYTTWKFPNCVGAIDGKHIRNICPAKSGSFYFNCKKYFSIVLQSLVDARYKFISIEVGSYGKQSDGGIFTTSSLYYHLEQNTFCVPGSKTLSGTNCSTRFRRRCGLSIKAVSNEIFSGQNMSQEQEKFNYCLSRARRLVECAFGIITSKWRILKTEIEIVPDKVDLIVKCICLLHNY
nr:protein ANTAGONIST OF LIKE HETEROCHROMATIN PROTEIN 1-like [Leptinotarsa decemlineata]